MASTTVRVSYIHIAERDAIVKNTFAKNSFYLWFKARNICHLCPIIVGHMEKSTQQMTFIQV